MSLFHHVLTNIQNSTPPPKHMSVRGNGKPGQKFNVERLEAACEKYGIDPCEAAVLGLDKSLTPDLKDKERADIALKLLEYLVPKQRAVDMDTNIRGDLNIVIERYSDPASVEAETVPTADVEGA